MRRGVPGGREAPGPRRRPPAEVRRGRAGVPRQRRRPVAPAPVLAAPAPPVAPIGPVGPNPPGGPNPPVEPIGPIRMVAGASGVPPPRARTGVPRSTSRHRAIPAVVVVPLAAPPVGPGWRPSGPSRDAPVSRPGASVDGPAGGGRRRRTRRRAPRHDHRGERRVGRNGRPPPARHGHAATRPGGPVVPPRPRTARGRVGRRSARGWRTGPHPARRGRRPVRSGQRGIAPRSAARWAMGLPLGGRGHQGH
jgi:hypothetical protein